jgi:SAM-dependent methyltransferase
VARRQLWTKVRGRFSGTWPPVGWVRFGGLRRLTPISRQFGFDRGTPVDRWYVEHFIGRFAGAETYASGDLRGRVLEVGDDLYARRFGSLPAEGPVRAGQIERLDVLHVSHDNPKATIVDDLERSSTLPDDAFDCVICTQTLHLLYDVRAAIATLHRILRPGGVVLVTVPGLSQRCNPDRDVWGEFWRFTSLSARRLFEESFPPAGVTVDAYGNVLTAIAFLHGLCSEELTAAELEPRDPDYEVLIGVRAVKERA